MGTHGASPTAKQGRRSGPSFPGLCILTTRKRVQESGGGTSVRKPWLEQVEGRGAARTPKDWRLVYKSKRWDSPRGGIC